MPAEKDSLAYGLELKRPACVRCDLSGRSRDVYGCFTPVSIGDSLVSLAMEECMLGELPHLGKT